MTERTVSRRRVLRGVVGVAGLGSLAGCTLSKGCKFVESVDVVESDFDGADEEIHVDFVENVDVTVVAIYSVDRKIGDGDDVRHKNKVSNILRLVAVPSPDDEKVQLSMQISPSGGSNPYSCTRTVDLSSHRA